jgi:hypothetical protein
MASKTIRISSNQKELLLLMFIKLKAHRWDKNALKKLLLELKNTDSGNTILFSLKESQIKTQYVGYMNDYILRKKLGEEGFNTTTNMLNGSFGDQFIVDILLSFRTLTGDNVHPRLRSLVPSLLRDFLDEVLKNYNDNSIPLNKKTAITMKWFATFNQNVFLKVYRRMWKMLKDIENGNISKGGYHDINSILSDNEQSLHEKRINICTDPKGIEFQLFFELPIFKKCFDNTETNVLTINRLFDDYDDKFKYYYPPWLQNIAETKCSEESIQYFVVLFNA